MHGLTSGRSSVNAPGDEDLAGVDDWAYTTEMWGSRYEPDALTRPRLLLAARLRGLREHRRVPVEDAAAAIGSPVLLRAMERGVTASSPHHVMTLATLYGVTDHAVRALLLQLALHSRQEGWWEPYRSLLRPGFLPYLGAEQAAQMIRCYAVEAVPDLLQHPDYAEWMILRTHPRAGEEERRRRLELRLRRQRILYAADPPRVWTIIDEAALLRGVAPPEAMYRQLDHLLDLCELPHVTVQIMPLSVGPAMLPNSITLVRVLQDRAVSQVAYLQRLNADMYPRDAVQARHWMNVLAIQAARPDETPGRLREAMRYLTGGAAPSADDDRPVTPGFTGDGGSVADDAEPGTRV
ncbi:DUF5753 domain-containing protein [Actinomadura syzygii]|uniref:Transcriptional regulator n=1 Tax=Actinomadura syzygii TaxID=1427538 RepID=A0A5D0ULF0_9ACTN|nr:DUF5753 domain-containing protein [Actinomadura syzygii]TYC18737.1 transcriptional regulator [Actinomadura syzygii]